MAKREPLLPHLPMKFEDAVSAFVKVKPPAKAERLTAKSKKTKAGKKR